MPKLGYRHVAVIKVPINEYQTIPNPRHAETIETLRNVFPYLEIECEGMREPEKLYLVDIGPVKIHQFDQDWFVFFDVYVPADYPAEEDSHIKEIIESYGWQKDKSLDRLRKRLGTGESMRCPERKVVI